MIYMSCFREVSSLVICKDYLPFVCLVICYAFYFQSPVCFFTAVMDTSTSSTAKYSGWLITASGVSPVMTKNQLTSKKTEHSHVTSRSKNQTRHFFT